MAVTPERLSKASVLVIYLILVLVIAGGFFLVIKSLLISVSLSLLAVSAIMILFYSQEIAIFSVFLFVIAAIISGLATFNPQQTLLFSSIIVGAFVAYSLVK